MNDFYARKPVAMWRITGYGILAAVGVATVGYLQKDHRLYIAAAFFGIVIGGFGFVLNWSRAVIKPIEAAPGLPKRFPRWVYWMFWIGLSASAALKFWDISRK